MPEQTAREIMARSEMTLSPETNIYRAMKSLLKHRLLGAAVVDAEGRLVGMLTEKDCLKMLAGEAFDGLPEGRVQDYMTRDVETMSPTAEPVPRLSRGFWAGHIENCPSSMNTDA